MEGSPEGDINLSPSRETWQRAHLDEHTRRVLAEDAEVFLHQTLSTPCLNALSSVRGSNVIDLEGRAYLDFHGNSVHQVGFGHPRVVQAVKAQLDTLPFCPRRYTNEAAIALARKLGQLAPGDLSKVLFAPGGAEAIGMALKLARVATGRHKVISMWDSFHGATLDATSVGGEAAFRQDIGPLMPGVEHVPPPDPHRCPLGCGGKCNQTCASYLEYVLEKEGDVAAVLAEPIRCTTATIPPPGYWQRIRAACDKHGTLLIFDEIPTWLGRTGNMFASEAIGVTPDMLVIGKGLGGGIVPMAAVIAHPSLDVAADRSLGHYTHEKSPVGCAAGLATIQVIEDEGLLQRSCESGAVLVAGLRELAKRRPLLAEVRGIGLLVAAELRHPDGSPASQEAEEVMYRCLSLGLNFKVSSGNVLTLTPALTISTDELRQAIDILDKALAFP